MLIITDVNTHLSTLSFLASGYLSAYHHSLIECPEKAGAESQRALCELDFVCKPLGVCDTAVWVGSALSELPEAAITGSVDCSSLLTLDS